MRYFFTNKLKRFVTSPFKLCLIQSNKIVFDNFAGRGMGDNPKYIMDALLAENRDLDLVWVVKDTTIPKPEGVRLVSYGSLRSFYEWATAKAWVDNIRITDRPAKRRGQIYLQTWHGSDGVKSVEKAVENYLSKWYLRMAKEDGKMTDAIVSSRQLQTQGIKDNFWLSPQAVILEVGLPRNDEFFQKELLTKAQGAVRKTYNIGADDLVVLYMPTFRDNHSTTAYNLDYQALVQAFEKIYDRPVKILVRFHPIVKDDFLDTRDDHIINVTAYPNAQDLMMMADVMITDYSSSSIDFMLLRRPVFLYLPDYEDYTANRPLDPNFELLPFSRSYDMGELVANITHFSQEEYEKALQAYEQKDQRFDKGIASEQVAEWLLGQMDIR